MLLLRNFGLKYHPAAAYSYQPCGNTGRAWRPRAGGPAAVPFVRGTEMLVPSSPIRWPSSRPPSPPWPRKCSPQGTGSSLVPLSCPLPVPPHSRPPVRADSTVPECRRGHCTPRVKGHHGHTGTRTPALALKSRALPWGCRDCGWPSSWGGLSLLPRPCRTRVPEGGGSPPSFPLQLSSRT